MKRLIGVLLCVFLTIMGFAQVAMNESILSQTDIDAVLKNYNKIESAFDRLADIDDDEMLDIVTIVNARGLSEQAIAILRKYGFDAVDPVDSFNRILMITSLENGQRKINRVIAKLPSSAAYLASFDNQYKTILSDINSNDVQLVQSNINKLIRVIED